MRSDEIEERAGSLFAPETMLATQYFDRIRRRKDLTGEQRLMCAVVEHAIDDYVKHAAGADRHRRALFAEAEQWIESTDRSWPFAFESICDYFDLDPGYVRRGLRDVKRRARGLTPGPEMVTPAAGERRRASNE